MISIDGDSFRAVRGKSGETYRRIDFGDVVADVDQVFPLPSGLDGFPALAVECKIQGGMRSGEEIAELASVHKRDGGGVRLCNCARAVVCI